MFIIVPDEPFDARGSRTDMHVKRAERVVSLARAVIGNYRIYAASHGRALGLDVGAEEPARYECNESLKERARDHETLYYKNGTSIILAEEYTPLRLPPGLPRRIVRTDRAVLACNMQAGIILSRLAGDGLHLGIAEL